MAEVKSISISAFEAMKKKAALSGVAKEAVEILSGLKKGSPILIEGASRGLQASLTRRIKKSGERIDMRVEISGKNRTIALLKSK